MLIINAPSTIFLFFLFYPYPPCLFHICVPIKVIWPIKGFCLCGAHGLFLEKWFSRWHRKVGLVVDILAIEAGWCYRESKFRMRRWQAMGIVIFIHSSWHEKKQRKQNTQTMKRNQRMRILVCQISQLGIYFVGRKSGHAVGHLNHHASTERVIAMDSTAAGPE